MNASSSLTTKSILIQGTLSFVGVVGLKTLVGVKYEDKKGKEILFEASCYSAGYMTGGFVAQKYFKSELANVCIPILLGVGSLFLSFKIEEKFFKWKYIETISLTK